MSGAPTSRAVLPWVALSLLAEGDPKEPRIHAVALLSSNLPKEPQVYFREEAVAHPNMRRALLSSTPTLPQLYPLLQGWVQEGRGLVLFDRFGAQLRALEQEFARLTLPPLSFTGVPTLEVYRSVAPHARARPTVERLIQENLGMVLSRGRESISNMWTKGDFTGALEALRQDVTGLYLLIDLGLKRGTVKLDGAPIRVDWDRRLRAAARAPPMGGPPGLPFSKP